MKHPIVTKIKNGKIALPREFLKDWKEGQVLFTESPGGFFIKSITPPSLSSIAKKLSKAAAKAKITPKDVREAVLWARKKVYEGRS